MHPTTLMSCPRIHRRNRRRQTRTAIRDDQRQVLAFQPAAIQILEQAFPVGLTLSLTAQKRQQVTPAIAPHAVSHQHLYPLASRWTPHPQAHSIQEQVSIVIAQLGLVKRRTASSRSRVSFETVAAPTTSPVRVATTRPTCRVLTPRKNAPRINSETSSARR